MSVYLDASVLLPNLVTEPSSLAVDAYLTSTTAPLVVSTFAASEVASGISRLVRTRQQTLDEGRTALADFDAWLETEATVLDIEPSDIRVAATFVRRFELMLRTPDALHVAVCARLSARLVTRDHRLAAAAGTLGVDVDLL